MKNTHHTKYRVIEDICQVNGVTPQQLLEQCQYLIGTMKEANNMSEEEKQTAINDTVIAV